MKVCANCCLVNPDTTNECQYCAGTEFESLLFPLINDVGDHITTTKSGDKNDD